MKSHWIYLFEWDKSWKLKNNANVEVNLSNILSKSKIIVSPRLRLFKSKEKEIRYFKNNTFEEGLHREISLTLQFSDEFLKSDCVKIKWTQRVK